MQFTSMLTYGFAIFSMFFGSGNLVFPLEIGLAAGSQWIFGFFGLLLTGILLPFLGLLVIKLHKGNYYSFFEGAGSFASKILPLFTLSLLGSFGVVPRCITVAHGGLNHIFPELSLLGFSLLFSLITFFLCLKDQSMVNILGKWMSPILLLSLLILLAVSIIKAPALIESEYTSSSFLKGFITGYQTMDLFAAFFFSALLFKQIQDALPHNATDREIIKYATIPSIIGSVMLSSVYLGLVFLGAHYKDLIATAEPERMLPTIATAVMGTWATAFIAITMVFSCLTTAIALNNIYARYLCVLFGIERKFPLMLIATTGLSFIFSMLDFRGIVSFLAPVLEISYPGLIALTITSIFIPHARKINMYLFWGLTILMVAFSINAEW